jgi:hypothetical protein
MIGPGDPAAPERERGTTCVNRGKLNSAVTGIAFGVVIALLASTNLQRLLPSQAATPPVPVPESSPADSREILVWRAASPGSPEEAPWTTPGDEITVLIQQCIGRMPPPTVAHPGTPLRFLIHRAVAIPPEHRGKPFHFNALLPRELPANIVLVHPREEVLECWVDRRFHLVAEGSAGARFISGL